ncbi:MAG: rhodanese-like domain-containing protein [Anaerolineales bacterium]|nr:MAG: rhodanese-like domain-containing protein [Anaerolineales bacterium]
MKQIFLLSILLVLLGACQGKPAEIAGNKVPVDDGAYTNVNADELNTMLRHKDFMFINVHIPLEGKITGTDLSIAYDQITDPLNLALLPVDKNAKIVLYCRSGRMSAIAAEALVKQGYTNIWNLAGGMADWELAGYELEK